MSASAIVVGEMKNSYLTYAVSIIVSRGILHQRAKSYRLTASLNHFTIRRKNMSYDFDDFDPTEPFSEDEFLAHSKRELRNLDAGRDDWDDGDDGPMDDD
jgi:hypothetical protein